MAQIIGKISNLDGSFYIKSAEGGITSAKVGDEIFAGDIVVGSGSNSNSNSLTVSLSDNSKVINIIGNNEQLFDETMLTLDLSSDTVVQDDELDESLLLESVANAQEEQDLTNQQANLTLEDIENLDAAAAGGDDPTNTEVLTARFEDRTGNEVDVVTDLRDTTLSATEEFVDEGIGEVIEEAATFSLVGGVEVIEETEGLTQISGTLDTTPTDTPLVITLSNGAEIVFNTDYVPNTPVQSSLFPINNDDDVFIDPTQTTLTVDSATGGGFTVVNVDGEAIVSVIDDVDTVTGTLSSNLGEESTEDAGSITYTITLTNPDGLEVAPADAAGETFSFTLNDGTSVDVTVPQGSTTGSTTLSWDEQTSDFNDLADADVFTDTTTISLEGDITSTNNSGYENIVTAGGSSEDVGDYNNTVTGTLSSNLGEESTEDAGSITYTITLTNPDGLEVAPTDAAGETFSFTLNDGTSVDVTVPQGLTTGSTTLSWDEQTSDFNDLADADLFKDTTTISLEGDITSTNNSGYENIVTAGGSSEDVGDYIDTLTVKLVAMELTGIGEDQEPIYTEVNGVHSVTEDDGIVYYKAVLEDSLGNRIEDDGTVTINFNDIGSATGVNSSTAPFANDGSEDFINNQQTNVQLGTVFSTGIIDDVLADSGETFTVSLESGSYSNGSIDYENVVESSDFVTTQILDESDPDTAYTLKLFAVVDGEEGKEYVDSNEIYEQNDAGTLNTTATYVVLAVDNDTGTILGSQPGGTLQVNVGIDGDAGTDDATINVDYTSTATRTETVGTEFTIDSIDDDLSDDGEVFKLSLEDGSWSKDADYEEVAYTGEVITTINDEPEDPDTFTVKLLALDADQNVITDNSGNYVFANSAIEGNAAYYKAVLVDDNGDIVSDSGTVSVSFTNGTAQGVDSTDTPYETDGSEDYINDTQTVTLGVPFSTSTLSDLSVENDETFTVSLVDGTFTNPSNYENIVTDTQTVTTSITDSSPVFIVGSGSHDVSGSTEQHTLPSDIGIIEGGIGDDVLVGDPGGSSIEPGSTANIVFVLDTSGSMVDNSISFDGNTITRLAALKLSVIDALQDINSSGADAVRVHIVEFGTGANTVGTYDVTTTAGLNSAISAVNGLDDSGYTNYEAGLVEANNWINSSGSSAPLSNADFNNVVFVSDGEPNRALDNSGNIVNVNSSDAMEHVLGNHEAYSWSWSEWDWVRDPQNDDNNSEVDDIELVDTTEQAFTIESIGINVSNTNLALLSQVEGSGGSATNVTTTEQLRSVIGELSGASTIHDKAGNDHIEGGDGDDLIFGDVLNTDALAQAQGLSTAEGSGWLVFEQLENDPSKNWTREDTLNYIKDYQNNTVATESGRDDGNDEINGGAGDDIIFAQEGDDEIDGGAGSDEIYGGSGDDTITYDSDDSIIDGGAGDDTLVLDTNTGIDFSALDNPDIQNIENIDLSGDNSLTKLTLQDVIDMTDGTNKTLIIKGDSLDSVELKDTSITDGWSKLDGSNNIITQDIDGVTYEVYTNTEDNTYKVLIQQDIVDTVIS